MVQQLAIAPNCSLLNTLVAVHIAYNTVKSHIQQFQQLVSLEPSIIDVLVATVPYPASEMVCALCNHSQNNLVHFCCFLSY